MKLPSYFRLAKRASKYSDHHAHQLGSLILIKGKPVSVGYNMRYKTHPIMKEYHNFKTIHAEVNSILNIKNKALLKGATMVTYRENKAGILSNSRPCSVCEQILRSFGFKEIIYTIDNGFNKEAL